MSPLRKRLKLVALKLMETLIFWFPSRARAKESRSEDMANPLVCNPVLAVGKENQWDEIVSAWASVVRCSTSDWRMYFSGKDKFLRTRVGLALSNDGIRWTKYVGNPIVNIGPPGTWDSYSVYCPITWKENRSWKMIFTGCDSPYSQHRQVGLAESEDGIVWRKFDGNPVYSNNNPSTVNLFGQYETEAWGLLVERNRYYLFYNPVNHRPRQVFIAESSDLISWKAISTRPILPSKGFPWSLGYMKYCAWPFKYEDDLYVLAATSDLNYTQSKIGLWKLVGEICSTTTAEFIGYITGASAEWCKKEVETPFVVHDSERGRILCYYAGRSARNEWNEGLATINTDKLVRVLRDNA